MCELQTFCAAVGVVNILHVRVLVQTLGILLDGDEWARLGWRCCHARQCMAEGGQGVLARACATFAEFAARSRLGALALVKLDVGSGCRGGRADGGAVVGRAALAIAAESVDGRGELAPSLGRHAAKAALTATKRACRVDVGYGFALFWLGVWLCGGRLARHCTLIKGQHAPSMPMKSHLGASYVHPGLGGMQLERPRRAGHFVWSTVWRLQTLA